MTDPDGWVVTETHETHRVPQDEHERRSTYGLWAHGPKERTKPADAEWCGPWKPIGETRWRRPWRHTKETP